MGRMICLYLLLMFSLSSPKTFSKSRRGSSLISLYLLVANWASLLCLSSKSFTFATDSSSFSNTRNYFHWWPRWKCSSNWTLLTVFIFEVYSLKSKSLCFLKFCKKYFETYVDERRCISWVIWNNKSINQPGNF